MRRADNQVVPHYLSLSTSLTRQAENPEYLSIKELKNHVISLHLYRRAEGPGILYGLTDGPGGLYGRVKDPESLSSLSLEEVKVPGMSLFYRRGEGPAGLLYS